MAYKIKITAESNGTIVIGIIFKILIPDFCIFILPLCAESKRRVVVGIYDMSGICTDRQAINRWRLWFFYLSI